MARIGPRGQATVEMALGSLVIITVLLFGIFFAEVGYLRLKANEAVSFALWEATSKKLHTFDVNSGRPDWSLYQQAIGAAAASAEARYADLDGRSSRTGGGGVTHVMAHASAVQVACRENRRVPFVRPSPIARGVLPQGDPLPPGDSGMTCVARLEIAGIRLPTAFLDSSPGALFSADHWRPVPLGVCAPRSPGCTRGYDLLLDDWGFSGPEERKECALAHDTTGCGGPLTNRNQGYYWMVELLAGSSAAGIESSQLAAFVAGTSPIDESECFLSFRGSESLYRETIPSGGGETDPTWETTPYSQACKNCLSPYAIPRPGCWLGKPCDPASW